MIMLKLHQREDGRTVFMDPENISRVINRAEGTDIELHSGFLQLCAEDFIVVVRMLGKVVTFISAEDVHLQDRIHLLQTNTEAALTKLHEILDYDKTEALKHGVVVSSYMQTLIEDIVGELEAEEH